MVQHRHRIDADHGAELADRKACLAHIGKEIESSPENFVLLNSAPRPGFRGCHDNDLLTLLRCRS